MFGSRILRLAKYLTESDEDAEDVPVETFSKASTDESGSKADEGMCVKLAIAVREASQNKPKSVRFYTVPQL